MSSSLDATQARIDAHLQSVHRCLVHPTSQLSALLAEEDTTDCIEAFDEPGGRIAAKVTHLQKNRIAALSTIPATTESDQSSLFDLFFSGVDLLLTGIPKNTYSLPLVIDTGALALPRYNESATTVCDVCIWHVGPSSVT